MVSYPALIVVVGQGSLEQIFMCLASWASKTDVQIGCVQTRLLLGAVVFLDSETSVFGKCVMATTNTQANNY